MPMSIIHGILILHRTSQAFCFPWLGIDRWTRGYQAVTPLGALGASLACLVQVWAWSSQCYL
jgi:hypothetical protein